MQIEGITDLVADTRDIWCQLTALGLERNAAELEVLGYTIIPPEIVGMGDKVAEAREAIIALAIAEGAEATDFETYQEGLSYEMYLMPAQGRVFEEWLLNPASLAIAEYLVGKNMILNNSLSFVKGPTDKYLRMHTDSMMTPDPLPPHRTLVNITICLTDYTLADGCIGVVPGSHHLMRHPTTPETTFYDLMQPIECPAGSIIVMPSNTWHGAFPRTKQGVRVTLVQAFSRPYLMPAVSHDIDQAILDRNPPRFAKLFGKDSPYPFGTKGLDLDKFARSYRSQRSRFS